MRELLCCALLAATGCTPIGKGNCVETEYYVGPSVSRPRIGTNGANTVVAWDELILDDDDPLGEHGALHGVLFDSAGGRIAGSEHVLEYPYIAQAFVGAPDRSLITGYVDSAGTKHSFYAIQLSTGEVLAPVEPTMDIRSSASEGTNFLVSTASGYARMTLDGVITGDTPMGRAGGALVAGATVTWMLWNEMDTVTGVRIARGGGVLDSAPRAIANGKLSGVTAARGDEVVFAALAGQTLTWSVLAADGTVTTSTSTTTAPAGASPYGAAYATALVAETGGYLMFIENHTVDSTEGGMMRITPAGGAGPYVPLGPASEIDAVALGGRAMAVYSREGVLSDTPAIDAIVVSDGAAPNDPITIVEPTGGHIEKNECGVL
jgi:hypothetical protein